jgi:16S rRNA (guanine527-N7)-methyltransferase
MLTREDRQLLKRGAHEFGVALTERKLELFTTFLEGLWSWNRRMNLTGITSKRGMLVTLLLDPLVALSYLPLRGTLLDIGSGAGIPGFPLKIARPAFEVHLLESKAKKVSFLKDIIKKVGLKGIKAYRGRAERRDDLSTLLNVYDIVTARALAPLKKTIGICSPYIKPGGLLVTFKGSNITHEIENSQDLIEELHFSVDIDVPYYLPETQGERYLLILKKQRT